MSSPLVTVITATTGHPLLLHCLLSVKNQTHDNIQHLVVVDGPDRAAAARAALQQAAVSERQHGYRLDVLELPYSIGKDRWKEPFLRDSNLKLRRSARR